MEDLKKDYLKEIQVHEQQEWDFEYVHQKTGERRWFHSVAMGSELNGDKKYILVMSDRTADKKMNQALSEAVHAAENANRAKEYFPFQYVPRYPHPHERHHRLYHAGCEQH